MPLDMRKKSLLEAIFLLAICGVFASPALAKPTWSVSVGGGVTRITWKDFDQDPSHYRLGVRADFTEWFGVSAEYLDTQRVSASTLPPGKLSFSPYILTAEMESRQIAAIFTWKPASWVSLYAKPALAELRTGHIMSGGTALPDDPADSRWQTSKSVRLVPAVGVAVHLGARVSASVEFEKTKAWLLEVEAISANLVWRF